MRKLSLVTDGKADAGCVRPRYMCTALIRIIISVRYQSELHVSGPLNKILYSAEVC